MLIGLITIAIPISFAIALLWMLSTTTRRDQPVAQKRRYHCVCVEAPGTSVCCARCEALRGRRFLVKAAPPLPVPGCTADVCTCRYVHFVDRRAGASRRRRDRGQRDSMPLIADRRRLRERGGGTPCW